MAIRLFACTVLLSCIAGTSALAEAAGYPSMVGVWKGSSESVVLGDHEHHQAGPQTPRLSSLDFTFTVEGQDGRRFWGTFASSHFNEPVLAVFRTDGVSVLAADGNGYTVGLLLGPGVLEFCHVQSGATMVASCTLLTRE